MTENRGRFRGMTVRSEPEGARIGHAVFPAQKVFGRALSDFWNDVPPTPERLRELVIEAENLAFGSTGEAFQVVAEVVDAPNGQSGWCLEVTVRRPVAH